MADAPAIAPAVVAGLMKELKELRKSPPDGITLVLNERNVCDVQADIEGPPGTPFEGGRFRLKVRSLHAHPILLALSLHSRRRRARPRGPSLLGLHQPDSTDCLSASACWPAASLLALALPNERALQLVLGADYPNVAPTAKFINQIFHPNVSKGGDVCVNTLKQDWSPTHGVRHILMVIRCLLIEPFPESALNEEASRLLMEDFEE